MAHLQYMPGDPRLVDQLVYELKSKGIFDQFRKDCIADVDTRPAYQNLRQRVENSVSSFLSRQCWKADLNKNQLREKLRKHILDGNYLEQGVERIVDQVVNPKVASVFIPQVEDLVYNYLGISRKKTAPTAETSNGKISTDDLLPTDLEAVSPGSVKSNDDKNEPMDEDFNEENKMEVDETKDVKAEEKNSTLEQDKPKVEEESQLSQTHDLTNVPDEDTDKKALPMHEDIRLENIPPPDNSPPKVELEKIELPKEPNIACEIPNPDEIPLPKDEKDHYFKPIGPNSDDESSSDSSLRRNMSPLTPIRNYNNENSCDAQQAFENDSDSKSNDKKEPSSFRFAIDAKSTENSPDKTEKKDEQANLAYQFNNQVNINTFNTPVYDDSSNSNNLQIDYESDVNSKTNNEKAPENDQNTEDKKDKKSDERKSSNKSSHRSRDSNRHSSSKDKRSDSKQSTSRDGSRHDKKPKDDHSKSKSSHKEREKSKERDRSERKDSRDSSKHRSSSHKSSSSRRDSKSHKSSSSRHSSDKKSSDDKKSSSSRDDKNRDKEKSDKSERSSDRSSKDKRDSKTSSSSSHRSDKDRKSSSKSKHEDKDKKKDKKETDDHYSVSGRGNHGRRSTDRDSNDGSSSSKGSHNQTWSKTTESKKETKESSSKSDNTSTSGESTSPSDKDQGVVTANDMKSNQKPIRVENHLEIPIASPPRLPFVPDVTLKKPKFAANLEEAKRMMKMRKFLDEEQKRMNQEAALLLEFQANVRPSLSQVYSSIPGPELEFACITNEQVEVEEVKEPVTQPMVVEESVTELKTEQVSNDAPIQTIENEIEEFEIKIEIKCEDTMTETESTDDKDLDDSKSSLDKSETYNENKPFSQLMDEISEYSKASEKNKKDSLDSIQDDDKKRTELLEVAIIAEVIESNKSIPEKLAESPVNTEPKSPEIEEIPVNTEDVPALTETNKVTEPEIEVPKNPENPDEENLKYFAEHEKFDAEIQRQEFSTFLKTFTEENLIPNKIHVINCDTYEENILKEVCANFGSYEVVNYYKNGHLRLPSSAKNVVKNINLVTEISLPVDPVDTTYEPKSPSPVFSPVKSECSFELSSDYDAKLEEMVNKTSRQEVMEIILGSVIDESDNPTIDYCTESSIDSEVHLKRKLVEVESPKNNNRHVLAKMRKLSDSDQISSTTEDLPNSPSSDKSVENYEQNTQSTPQTPNGKFKSVTRNKVQRYDTSDLYKPKLHYLSRRNNIS
ncbi:biorientation of chromosomes in cell division protein 1-like 1 isoform X2 [Trichoplusia ni]|uniref:Biorientation of chromosomes in cell division protein 1-like 1 isoform X2 n=1 Tax=Trichoplusia ni TaxID=7111 RepID=A0A7E5VLV5_TRINI|nr:biorientation of chromosomes in cell division protein 1-like 1 isoform X2 [Trichoplusia ni]